MTIATALASEGVDEILLQKKYGPILKLVREMLGFAPSCYPLLEIWPQSLVSYSLLVPNMLNLPQLLFSSRKLKQAVGLAMYTSSRAAQCMYCSSHTCTFSLRRGIDPEVFNGQLNDQQEAIKSVAEGLSMIPVSLRKSDCDRLRTYLTDGEVETVVYAVGLMGFLNKFMDAMGTPLEVEAMNDTAALLTPSGWQAGQHFHDDLVQSRYTQAPVDNLVRYLRIIRLGPAAMRIEKKWLKGIPKTAGEAMNFLSQKTGYHFPIIEKFRRKRVVVTITNVIADNFREKGSTIPGKTKVLAGYIFAKSINSNYLMNICDKLSGRDLQSEDLSWVDRLLSLDLLQTEAINDVTHEMMESHGLQRAEMVLCLLTRAASTSPSQISPSIVCMSMKELTGSQVIELLSCLSVLQMLHRLHSYYSIANGN